MLGLNQARCNLAADGAERLAGNPFVDSVRVTAGVIGGAGAGRGVGAGVAAFTSSAGDALVAARASALVILPSFPDPSMVLGSKSCSSTILRTAGDK